mmetsp:Transcript_132273/g.263926  ORF Transcript_132273/g.263926 Transcript_132273/m.263926 type:complete len:118 (-) Transcript_132273:140-493(-)
MRLLPPVWFLFLFCVRHSSAVRDDSSAVHDGEIRTRYDECSKIAGSPGGCDPSKAAAACYFKEENHPQKELLQPPQKPWDCSKALQLKEMQSQGEFTIAKCKARGYDGMCYFSTPAS